ncbi:hypothetical protein P7C70_g7008, partial [Phenoliferia sp. Uapishka_3]
MTPAPSTPPSLPPTSIDAPTPDTPSRSSSTSSISISRASGRRALQSVPTTNPLASSPSKATDGATFEIVSGSSTGPYPVYTGRAAKRLSAATTDSQPSPPSIATPLPQPPPTPPPAPNSPSHSTSLPPLVSRPSSSAFPATQRPPARSVSEATRSLLKAKVVDDVQSLGLSMDSCGAAMILKLGALGKEHEWAGILAAVGAGKVTLLLPAEKLPAPAFLTPAFFLDHLAILETTPIASTSTAPPSARSFATLSGFRGITDSDSMTILSCGTAVFESTTGLFKPGSLAAPPFADYNFHLGVLGGATPTPPSTPSSIFPTFSIVAPQAELSIPKTSSSRPSASPVPERRMESLGRAAGATGSRLAALFAKSQAPTLLDDLPPIVPAPPGLLDPSPSSLEHTPSEFGQMLPTTPRSSVPNLDVFVMGIDKIIRHAEVAKSVGKAVEQQLRERLRDVDGLEDSNVVADHLCAFAQRFQPPLGWTTSLFTPGKFPPSPDSLFTKDVGEASDQLESLFYGVREELSRGVTAKVAKKRREAVERGLGEKDLEEVDHGSVQERVDAALEEIEHIVTVTLYDRLFSPQSSGDVQEDENLASRIAALNILELSLDHLGIDLGGGGLDDWNDGQRTIRDSLEDIIGSASKELARLQELSVRSPASKLAVFVNIHKIIVEELSKLPNIPLKETTDSAPFTVRNPSQQSEVEMDDASNRAPSLAPSRSISPPPIEDPQTPRPKTSIDSALPNLTHIPPLESPDASSTISDLTSSMHEASLSSVFDVNPRREPEPSRASSSSADLILPLLIYLVVQYNPPKLPSTLNYIQRFRSDLLLRGEASYCVTNIHAVCEFLNSVDISALGLSSQKIAGNGSFSPVLSMSNGQALVGLATAGTAGKLKGRVSNVTQELDQFVDSANSAIVNVVDSSFRMLFGAKGQLPKTIEDVKNVLDGAGNVASKARGTLLRRATSPAHFQAPSAVDVPGVETPQREMVDISASSAAMDSEDDDSRSVRSARSVSSFLKTRDISGTSEDRPSIGERLASIASLQRFGSPSNSSPAKVSSDSFSDSSATNVLTVQLQSFLSTPSATPTRRATVTSSTFDAPPMTFEVPPRSNVTPVQRFLECRPEDLRIGEIEELLSEYRKLAAELKRLAGEFDG